MKAINCFDSRLDLSQIFCKINKNIIRDTNEEYDRRDLIGCDINCNCVINKDIVEKAQHFDLSLNIKTIGKCCECSRDKSFIDYNYDSNGLLINWRKPIYECGLNCFCVSNEQLMNECLNRLTQYNTKCETQVFFDQLKGYSVRTLNHIKLGQFVAEYCGEVINKSEARIRFESYNKEEHNYILIFREHFGIDSTFETIIDARFYGNESRLINHSCDPNLIALPVRSDSLRARICLFAVKDIETGSELCYNYGSNDSQLSNKLCFCMTDKCNRFMPLDFTL